MRQVSAAGHTQGPTRSLRRWISEASPNVQPGPHLPPGDSLQAGLGESGGHRAWLCSRGLALGSCPVWWWLDVEEGRLLSGRQGWLQAQPTGPTPWLGALSPIPPPLPNRCPGPTPSQGGPHPGQNWAAGPMLAPTSHPVALQRASLWEVAVGGREDAVRALPTRITSPEVRVTVGGDGDRVSVRVREPGSSPPGGPSCTAEGAITRTAGGRSESKWGEQLCYLEALGGPGG